MRSFGVECICRHRISWISSKIEKSRVSRKCKLLEIPGYYLGRFRVIWSGSANFISFIICWWKCELFVGKLRFFDGNVNKSITPPNLQTSKIANKSLTPPNPQTSFDFWWKIFDILWKIFDFHGKYLILHGKYLVRSPRPLRHVHHGPPGQKCFSPRRLCHVHRGPTGQNCFSKRSLRHAMTAPTAEKLFPTASVWWWWVVLRCQNQIPRFAREQKTNH